MQFAVITNVYDYALRARLIQHGKPVAYETHILCSANHTPIKDVSSCVCLKFLCCCSGSRYMMHVSEYHLLIIISTNNTLMFSEHVS